MKLLKHNLFAGLVLALTMLFGTIAATAQINVAVKGAAKDDKGAPLVGARIEFVNKDNGRKFSMKTDKKGEYMNIGLIPGNYKATLFGPEGKELTFADNVRVDPS